MHTYQLHLHTLKCISSIFQDHLVYHQHLQITPSWLCPPKEPSKIDSMQPSISEVQQLPMTFEMYTTPTKHPSFHSTLILKAVIRWPKIPLSRNLYVEDEECILLHFDPTCTKGYGSKTSVRRVEVPAANNMHINRSKISEGWFTDSAVVILLPNSPNW